MVNFNRYWWFLLIQIIFWVFTQIIAPDQWDNAVAFKPYDATIKIEHKLSRKYLTGG
jgi:hypothetical protein